MSGAGGCRDCSTGWDFTNEFAEQALGKPQMSEEFSKSTTRELLLKACLLPFVLVGGITVSFYDVAMLDKHGLAIFLSVAITLHLALLLYWIYFVRRLVADAKRLSVSLSMHLLCVGSSLAYAFGLFIGWVVHKSV
jgi:hypothetical protein